MFTVEGKSNLENSKVQVTFFMPAIEDCESLYLVGWFSESTESEYCMDRTSGGGWRLTLELDLGCHYLYRFRTGNGTWLRDPSMPANPLLFGLNSAFFLSGVESR